MCIIRFSDLEAREHAGLSEQQRKAQQARNLEKEIERLRKEGNSLLEREQALLQQELEKQAKERREQKKNAANGIPAI